VGTRRRRGDTYDVVSAGGKSDLRRVVEGFNDIKENVEGSSKMPMLNEMLNSILRGDLWVEAVFVRNLDVLGRADLVLGIKRVLELRGVKLISLRGRDRAITEVSLEGILYNIRARNIADAVVFSIAVAAGAFFIYMTMNPIYAAIICATIALMLYTHRKRALRSRAEVRKLVERLLKIDLRARGIEVVITKRRFEIRERYRPKK